MCRLLIVPDVSFPDKRSNAQQCAHGISWTCSWIAQCDLTTCHNIGIGSSDTRQHGLTFQNVPDDLQSSPYLWPKLKSALGFSFAIPRRPVVATNGTPTLHTLTIRHFDFLKSRVEVCSFAVSIHGCGVCAMQVIYKG